MSPSNSNSEADIRRELRPIFDEIFRVSIKNALRVAALGRKLSAEDREKFCQLTGATFAAEPWWDSDCEEAFREVVTGP